MCKFTRIEVRVCQVCGRETAQWWNITFEERHNYKGKPCEGVGKEIKIRKKMIPVTTGGSVRFFR